MAKNEITIPRKGADLPAKKDADNALAAKPEWLTKLQAQTDVSGLGIAEMGEFKIIPRAKIIQKQSNSDLIKKHYIGTVIIAGTDVEVAKIERDSETGPSFRVKPFFFFPEWMTFNDIRDKGANTIRYRTIDKKDPLVAKCRNEKLRVEKYRGTDGKEMEMKHKECMNFVCEVDEGALKGTVLVISFMGGEHKQGRNLCSHYFTKKIPVFGQVFEFNTQLRPEKNGGDWYGWDYKPVEFVDEAEFNRLGEMHTQYREAHQALKLQVVGDEEDQRAGDQRALPPGDPEDKEM